MENITDHPGVYVPPPLFYIITFLASLLIQKFVPLDTVFFYTTTAKIIGSVIIIAGLFFSFPSMRQFVKTKNTIVTIKPANSLQTTGIYSVTRNPMYISLLLFYTGLAFMIGNWWNIILLPLLFLFIQQYVIGREEKYLTRKFGNEYTDYRQRVRRWL
jgi:protein-S-isoprenylcysteine O-methyltransferase Ste14